MVNRHTKQGTDNGTDRRDQIRTLAAEMFFDLGYEATTMRQVAAAMDIKSASLYYHFPDKEQILFEIIESVLKQLILGVKKVVQREETHALRLAALVVNHVVLHAIRPKETTLGDSELRSLSGERHKTNVGYRDAYQRQVVAILKDGQAAGSFNLIDPKITAYAIIAQSSHVGTWFRGSGRLSLGKVAEMHAALALRMVAGPPVPSDEIQRLVSKTHAFHEALL
jgi:AcrR family transcriptional regulator